MNSRKLEVKISVCFDLKYIDKFKSREEYLNNIQSIQNSIAEEILNSNFIKELDKIKVKNQEFKEVKFRRW